MLLFFKVWLPDKFNPVVRSPAGMQTDSGSYLLRLNFLLRSCFVVCEHCLATFPTLFNETLKRVTVVEHSGIDGVQRRE